jgi:DNA primase catalytic core
MKEVEAESVAYLTLAAHGVATGSYSFPYVDNWAFALADAEHVPMADIVARTGRRVLGAAHSIIEATESTETPNAAEIALATRASLAGGKTETLREETEVRAEAPAPRAVLMGIVADSQEFFRSRVHDSWVPGYLDSRKVASALESHGIGYAPAGWTALTDHLRSLGYTDEHIQAAGMATRARTGNLIDRFRDRLTIPLGDADGDLVGFTARSAPDADSRAPKYINSPASSIFNKSEILYGLSDLPDLVRAGYIPVVCEGAFDAIAIDVASAANYVGFHGLATCGTAFTDAHARHIIAADATSICLAYDGDAAGHTAAGHAWTKITEAGTYNITITELPAGADPASLNADDANDLIDRLHGARDGALVVVDQRIAAAHIVDDLPRQYGLFHDIVEWAAQLPAERRVDVAIHAARQLGIHPDDAAAELTQNNPGFMADSLQSIADHCDSVSSILDSPPKAYDERQPFSSERTIRPPAIAS